MPLVSNVSYSTIWNSPAVVTEKTNVLNTGAHEKLPSLATGTLLKNFIKTLPQLMFGVRVYILATLYFILINREPRAYDLFIKVAGFPVRFIFVSLMQRFLKVNLTLMLNDLLNTYPVVALIV